jgi:hypothetical protein
MKVYELCEINSKPNRNDCRYTNYRIYNNSLYIEAESLVDCNYDTEEEMTDEEFDRLVELELRGILRTLETHGRYPINGIPKFVAY